MQLPGSGIEPPEPQGRIRAPRALRPLLISQYRILAVAIMLSLLGAGVWIVAIVWQVIELGGAELEVSLIAGVASVGMLLCVLFAGAVADRVRQKYILVTVEGVKTIAVAVAAVLSLSGTVELWHLVLVGLVLGVADAFFYPAYTAMLPSILPPEQLLAANGLEGMLRPAMIQGVGPVLAAGAIGLYSPGMAFAILAVAQLLATLMLLRLKSLPVRRDLASEQQRHPVMSALVDMKDGFLYMLRTPWLLWTLLFACVMVLLIMGPIEVLLPFAVRSQTGGEAESYAAVLAAFGLGGVVGSLVTASLRLPRRYLTVMVVMWGAGCLPLAVIGVTDQLWVMLLTVFVTGYTFSAATVIWGTLLQRRVPPAMLGRVSSLDFFVSLTLMPVSIALAGPLAVLVGIPLVFAVAGILPVLLAVLVLFIGRMPQDELANPLDPEPIPADS